MPSFFCSPTKGKQVRAIDAVAGSGLTACFGRLIRVANVTSLPSPPSSISERAVL